jgi:hypothetical protein
MIVEPGKTYVRRLRAVSAERDALALRLRLERTLSGADFHPPGLPAGAVLCVRRLSGRRAGAPLAPGGGASALADWQRAVAAAIEQLARHAASPARGAVPANAEAVIFRDQAELLACLAADCGDEAAPARWWWRSLFGGRDAAAALLSAWLASPEHVPAALGRLSTAGKLVPFARRLSEGAARAVRRSVVHQFGLHELHAALEAPAGREARPAPRAALDADADADAGRAAPPPTATRAAATAPWERDVPELRGQSLGREQACLVGVGLMLLRAPSRVRSSSFARLVTDWRTGTPDSDETPPAHLAPASQASKPRAVEAPQMSSVSDDELNSRASSEGVTTDARGSLMTAAVSNEAAPGPAVGQGRVVNESASHVTVRDEQPRQPTTDVLGAMSDATREAVSKPVLRDLRSDGGVAPQEPRAGRGENAEEEFARDPLVYEARVQTKFGGLFYLINLGLFLNLYGDFTTPLSPGLALSIWDFLALLGRRLCGDRVREDAVWALLAGLAGRREDEPPGHDFFPADEWRLPPDWLAPFAGRRVWEWAAGGGRLRVRHPAGFLVLDVPLRADEGRGRQLADELRAYGGRFNFTLRRAKSEIVAGVEGGALERWLERLTPYVNTRLRGALGRGEAARLVCEHEARVVVTETRLDVTFALARLPFEVRLSGLDRDPGWVPAAGRRVAFHYE